MKFEQRALEKGGVVSRPTTDVRYDRILDLDGKLYRVQIKHTGYEATKADGAYVVNLKTSRNGRVTHRSYDREEIEAVVAYIVPQDALVWIPVDLLEGRSTVTLRVRTPKPGGNHTRVKLVTDFLW